MKKTYETESYDFEDEQIMELGRNRGLFWVYLDGKTLVSDRLNKYRQTKPPTNFGRGLLLVEAAGQLVHIFQYGLDYTFTSPLNALHLVGRAGRVIHRN